MLESIHSKKKKLEYNSLNEATFCLDYSLKRNCQGVLNNADFDEVAAPLSLSDSPGFLLLEIHKGRVYKPPLSQTMDESTARITAAFQTVTTAILIKVSDNWHRLLSRVTKAKGGHFENLRF